MLDFIERLTGIFGGKGNRTTVAAVIAAVVALNHALHFVDDATMNAILALAVALGLYSADESSVKTPASS